jgi:hypothetical protein
MSVPIVNEIRTTVGEILFPDSSQSDYSVVKMRTIPAPVALDAYTAIKPEKELKRRV